MKRFVAPFLALFLVAAAGAPAPARAAEAEQFVQNLGNSAIAIIAKSKSSGQPPIGQFTRLLNSNFDLPTIGRFVLGRYWREASPQQQDEYMSLFEDLIVRTYANRFQDYSGETFEVTGSQPTGNGRYTIVSSRIQRPGSQPIEVQWRVRNGGDLRILDVIVEGVSLSVSQREEYAAVIQRNGGKIDALINSMRQKIAQLG